MNNEVIIIKNETKDDFGIDYRDSMFHVIKITLKTNRFNFFL